MQAVILAGGLGTRLRPFTTTIPKPLLPLGDRPIVSILLHQLRDQGFTRICMCLGYMASLFQAFVGDGTREGLHISYVVEDRPLGTAGALQRIAELDDNFVVLNGDTLTTVSFRGLLDAHVKASASGTVFTAKIDEFVDYGVVEFDPQSHALMRYIEKPTRHYFVSTGIYALSREILKFATPDASGRLDMPDLLRNASQNGGPVFCYTQDNAYWRDIGRFDHYEAASKDFQENPERFLKTPAQRQ